MDEQHNGPGQQKQEGHEKAGEPQSAAQAALSEADFYTETVSQKGMTVTIDIHRVPHEGWRLRIHGKRGQWTEWTDCFPSWKNALRTARAAILEEGIEAFYSSPDFSWLNKL